MTDLAHVNFQLTQKFDGNYEVSVAPGGCGIDLYERDGPFCWIHFATFDDLHEVESELLDKAHAGPWIDDLHEVESELLT